MPRIRRHTAVQEPQNVHAGSRRMPRGVVEGISRVRDASTKRAAARAVADADARHTAAPKRPPPSLFRIDAVKRPLPAGRCHDALPICRSRATLSMLCAFPPGQSCSVLQRKSCRPRRQQRSGAAAARERCRRCHRMSRPFRKPSVRFMRGRASLRRRVRRRRWRSQRRGYVAASVFLL